MKTTLNIIGQFASKASADEFTTIAGRVQGVNVMTHVAGDGWTVDNVGSESMPDVLVLEIDASKTDELAFAEATVGRLGNRVNVFVTYREGAIDILRRLMRSGVKDIFQQPFIAQDVVQDLTVALTEKRMRLKAAQGARGGVTAFINAKGGSGATTLAVNTAHTLATEYQSSVALIDLDVQFGACALMLDLKPQSTVFEALLQPERIDAVFLQALMTKHKSGVDVLCAPADVSPMDRISSEAITRLLGAAVENYDFVIVDVPRVITPWTMAALRFAEPVMVVAQNSLTTIRDAKVLLDKFSHEGLNMDSIELINNRAMAKSGSIPIDKFKETLQKAKMHRIRNDYQTVVESQDQGRPAREVSAHSNFSKDILSLAGYLAKAHMAVAQEKKGFLQKLFGA
jgi:pilus assembly protein CpaE